MTTWVSSEKTDPLTGDKVAAKEIMTYGNYIYKWPSKYDLVFWPLIAEEYICLNTESGYGAFNEHFETLPDEEKEAMSKWLKKNYKPSKAPKSHTEKLVWIERVYCQRKMDDSFWCVFYRLMAYIHKKDEKQSMAYVKKVMPLLKKKLQENPEGLDKIEVLYLLGEYHRRLGENEKAEMYFSQVKKEKYKDKDEDRGLDVQGRPGPGQRHLRSPSRPCRRRHGFLMLVQHGIALTGETNGKRD